MLLYASSVATRRIHLAPPGNRTRTFAVGGGHHNHYATGNWWVLQTHYVEFQLALHKTLFHAIATHSLANNTLPVLQKTKLHILRLPPLLFYKGFTISKLISFASWETVAYCQMGVCSAARILTFLGNRTRTSAVRARYHNHFAPDGGCVLWTY